jgi:hypothetical protein
MPSHELHIGRAEKVAVGIAVGTAAATVLVIAERSRLKSIGETVLAAVTDLAPRLEPPQVINNLPQVEIGCETGIYSAEGEPLIVTDRRINH